MTDFWELICFFSWQLPAVKTDLALTAVVQRFFGLGGYTGAVFLLGYLTARARWKAALEAARFSDCSASSVDSSAACDELLSEIRLLLESHSDSAGRLHEQLETTDRDQICNHARMARQENEQFRESLNDRCAELKRHPRSKGRDIQQFVRSLAGHQKRATELDGVLSKFEDAGQFESAILPLRECIERLQDHNRRLQAELDETRKAVAQQSRKLEQAQAEARIDALTGLPNRRAFDELIEQAHALFNRGNSPYVVALLDIDHFKRFNDEHGHAVGDKVLGFVADVLRRTQRWTDHVARFGGEEFVVLMPRLTGHKAKFVVDRQRALVENAALEIEMQKLSVTVSAGVAEVQPGESISTVLARADEALYAAKAAGRNRTCLEDAGRIVHLDELQLQENTIAH